MSLFPDYGQTGYLCVDYKDRILFSTTSHALALKKAEQFSKHGQGQAVLVVEIKLDNSFYAGSSRKNVEV